MNANSHSHNNKDLESQGVKPATQARSRKSRDKIVQAFSDLLRTKSFEHISIAEIAREAGVAVGTVYRRFENKDALIPVVFELYQKRLEAWSVGEGRVEIAEGTGLRDVLQILVQTAWDVLNYDGHILRTAHLYARLKPELVGNEDIWKAWEEAGYQTFQPLMQAFPESIKRSNLEATARMLTYFMNAFFLEKALYPNESPAAGLDLSDEVFLAEATDMLYGYLTLEPRS